MAIFNQGDVRSSFLAQGDEPTGLSVDSDNCIWQVEFNSSIFKTGHNGCVGSQLPHPGDDPQGIGIDSAGCLWVADDGDDRIYKLDQTGSVNSSISSPGPFPRGVGVDNSGCIIVDDRSDNKIYRSDQAGNSGGITQTPSDFPQGVEVDADGCIWHVDGCTAKVYKFTSTGAGPNVSFGAPKNEPIGVGVDVNDWLWVGDQRAFSDTGQIFQIANVDRAVAQGTKPTLSVTANTVESSNSVSAQGTKPTMDSTPRTAHSNLSHVGTAQNPTMTATAKSATGSALANATANKPTASATTRTGAGYADVPLIDGELIDEDTGQIYRWDELELAIRCDKATLDAIIRPLEQEAGEFEKNDTPDGGFVTQDSADGANTFRYSPRYAEYPVAINQQVLVDTYTESPASKDFGEFRVRVVFKLDQNRPTQSNVISESVGSSDWAFHFYSGTIATERVRRDVQAETQEGTLGFILNVFLDDNQAEALRKTTGRQGAVTTTGGSRGNVSAIDNSPNSENTVYLEPRDTKQISEGRYVLRSSELERLDPEGTFYRARLEIVPENRGAWGVVGRGKVGEFKHGEP